MAAQASASVARFLGRRTVDDIAAEVAALEAKRAGLVETHAAAALDAQIGEDGAAKQIAQVEGAIASLDRDIARLRAAHESAVERVAREDRAAAAKEQAAASRAAARKIDRVKDAATGVDAALAALNAAKTDHHSMDRLCTVASRFAGLSAVAFKMLSVRHPERQTPEWLAAAESRMHNAENPALHAFVQDRAPWAIAPRGRYDA